MHEKDKERTAEMRVLAPLKLAKSARRREKCEAPIVLNKDGHMCHSRDGTSADVLAIEGDKHTADSRNQL